MSKESEIRAFWNDGLLTAMEVAEQLGLEIDEVDALFDKWWTEEEDGQYANWENEGYAGRRESNDRR